jgi:hypothetical protein
MQRKFTREQIKKLSENENVKRCGHSSVIYTKAFKEYALKQYEKGMTAVGIFQAAGFDLSIIGSRAPNRIMNQWKNALNVKKEGIPIAAEDARKGKRNRHRKELNDLRAKVAYLEAENDFLTKLRAKKRR